MRSYLWISILAAACGGNPTTATEDVCTDGVDDDDDGAVDCADTDCDDDDACIGPATEICTGGVDEDGNGLTDCEDPICFEDPACFDFDDPTDLPGPDGDPSIDIDKFGVDVTAGTATFFATTDGTWPPPASTYSWFITFEIDNDGNSAVAGVTVQHHDGVDSTNPSGIPAANITIRQTPAGIWARMTGVPATGVKFYVESGIQKSNPGTRVTDTVVGAPADLP